LTQPGCVIDVVVDEQPGLDEAAMGDEIQCLTCGGGTIRDPVAARNEDAAEIDETLLQRVPGFAVLRPFGVELPDTRVAVSCLIGEFACQGGFADAAEAVNRRRLSDRSRIARSECVPDLAQLVGAAREARQ